MQLEPSPALLQASGGAVIHTGFLYCHKFNAGSDTNLSPLQPMIKMKLGEPRNGFDRNSPINYGKLWSVLKQGGEVQCMVDGKPETLFSVHDCSLIRVNNPQTMQEGSDYCIRVSVRDKVFVLRAELPTDHCDWTLALEKLMQENGKAKLMVGDKYRENGYIALKRLMSLQNNGGIRGSQLISPMVELEALQDLYDSSLLTNYRASPDGCEEKGVVEGPPVPPRGSSAPPPPLPPKDPPPLPPKRGNSLQRIRTPSIASTVSNGSVDFDEYVSMQPPSSLNLTSPLHSSHGQYVSSAANCSIPSPITEGDDYMPMKGVVIDTTLIQRKENIVMPTQPIMIPVPLRRSSSSKRSILLRSTSDSDSSMHNTEATPPLPPRGPSPRHHPFSYNNSPRMPSGVSSINSLGSSISSLHLRGNSSLTESRGRVPMLIPRSNSVIQQPISPLRTRHMDTSVSDGMVAREAREQYNHVTNSHMTDTSHSHMGSVSSVVSSENGLDISGLSSSSSSVEDVSQV